MDESDIVTPQPLAERPVGSGLLTGKNVAIAVGVVALLEAGALVRLATRTVPATASVPAAVSIPVTIDSPVAGDVVMVDGHQVGLTPFQLNIDSGGHSIRVISMDRLEEPVKAAPTLAPVPATRTAAEVRTAALLAQAASRQRSGGLQITSPVEIQVLEGDRVLGSSADGPIVAPEGVHQLELINLALGYRSRQTVEVKAGQIIPLIVKPPDGKLSVNALPWAQVWIDGTLVGETPLANLSLPIGQHEIVFRHPQFGEKRETVITKSGAAARISATLGR